MNSGSSSAAVITALRSIGPAAAIMAARAASVTAK